MTTQIPQSQTNFNQPQSLVKYSNPVLVSTAGKKQVKVIYLFIFRKKLIHKILLIHIHKISLILYFHQENTQLRNNNSGNMINEI
jgi:hypothetical protein